MSLPQISLRTLLWILFAAAIATGWGWERWGYLAKIAEKRRTSPMPNTVRPEGPSRELLKRLATVERLAKLSEEELRAELFGTAFSEAARGERGLWLTELVNRSMVNDLQTQLDILSIDSHGWRDAEMLTALRRAEWKADPIQIGVRLVPPKSPHDHKDCVLVEGIVRNDDVDHQLVQYTAGLDWKVGKLARWRLELRDEQGNLVPDFNLAAAALGSSNYYDRRNWRPSNEWRDVLNPRYYVSPPSSGRYQLQLIHSDAWIDDEPDLTGLIVWKSEPIWVEVVNQETEYVDYSLVRLIFVVVIAIGLVAVIHFFSAHSDSNTSWLARWGDVAFCLVVIALAVGWWVNVGQLNDSLAQSRKNAEPNWTIVEPQASQAEKVSPQ